MNRGFGFRHALRGVLTSLRQERNMRVHLLAVLLVTAAGILGKIERWAWAAVLICFGLVIAAELLNSVVERLCDKITQSRCPEIRDIKDMAAGAVLICAVVSVIVAIVVFARREVLEGFLSWFS